MLRHECTGATSIYQPHRQRERHRQQERASPLASGFRNSADALAVILQQAASCAAPALPADTAPLPMHVVHVGFNGMVPPPSPPRPATVPRLAIPERGLWEHAG
eukprot:1896695-Prymnesium_polylepis.2